MKYVFEWDYRKAKTNIQKHHISFEDATSVFRDEKMLSIFDQAHSDEEERWITIGMDLKSRTLVVIHTFITVNEEHTKIRIISARKATKKEQKIYWEQ